jgi:hypothetical protein
MEKGKGKREKVKGKREKGRRRISTRIPFAVKFKN